MREASWIASEVGATIKEESEEQVTYNIACNATYAPLVFEANGKKYEISSKFLNVQDGNNETCTFGVAGLFGVPFVRTMVLGGPFMRAYCVSHDIQKMKIGFSKPKVIY
uniref:Peptidase A1 domain-containing protein n=1 Tax=Ditylenchus dipsaci TaxID=166011 RepID=A0A915EI79_9BILA